METEREGNRRENRGSGGNAVLIKTQAQRHTDTETDSKKRWNFSSFRKHLDRSVKGFRTSGTGCHGKRKDMKRFR